MNNRNVDIKNTFSSSLANTALQVTSAHDQRYSTFKMAAEVIKKKKTNIRDKKPKNTFSRGCEQAEVTSHWKKKKKKKLRHLIVSCSVNSTHCPFHIIVAHRKWTVTFDFILFIFYSKNDCTSATIDSQKQLCRYKTGNCISPFFFFPTQMGRGLQMYISVKH